MDEEVGENGSCEISNVCAPTGYPVAHWRGSWEPFVIGYAEDSTRTYGEYS